MKKHVGLYKKALALFSSLALVLGLFPVTALGQDLAVGSTNSGFGLTTQSKSGLKVKQVALGDFHSAAISSNGSLWMWGSNGHGQIGDGTTEDRYAPVKALDSVSYASAVDNRSAAIKSDGSLWMWGENDCGRLGDGTTEDRNAPVKVLDSVAAVSLGYYCSAAIRTDGSLWMWGSNGHGQIGDGTTEDRYAPVKVLDSVSSVSIGDDGHLAAIRNDGSLWAWGNNRYGEIGDGTTENRNAPVKVLDSVAAVSLGYYCSAAIRTDGSLWMWGDNRYGEIGDGTTENRNAPVKVLDSVAAVSLGYYCSAAIRTDGSLWMWGYNWCGQLGDGTTEDRSTPVKVLDSVSAVSLCSCRSAAIKSDGSLLMWGDLSYRIDDDPDNPPKAYSTPTEVIDSVDTCLIGGNDNSAVIRVDGSLWTWGLNWCGNGSRDDWRSTPTQIFFPLDKATISGLSAQTYTGKALTPKPTVKIGDTVLTEGADYTLSYKNNVEAGTATVVITGAGILSGSVSSSFTIKKTEQPKAFSVALAKANYAYTGKAIKPKVTVKSSGRTLVKGADYTVSYPKSPVKAGTYKLTVKGKGEWKGQVKKTYRIVLNASRITSLKALPQAGAVSAKWKKVKGASGYQMWISASKKFGKGTVKTDFSAKRRYGKRCAFSGSGLPQGKKLYVKVRAYQKAGNETHYSSWSKVKTVNTRG